MADVYLTTRPGQGLQAAVAAKRDVVGATLTVEYSTTSSFKTVRLSKPTTATGRQVNIVLTPDEVTTLKDCYFRVKAVKLATVYVSYGEIAYLEPAVDPIDQKADVTYVDNTVASLAPVARTGASLTASVPPPDCIQRIG